MSSDFPDSAALKDTTLFAPKGRDANRISDLRQSCALRVHGPATVSLSTLAMKVVTGVLCAVANVPAQLVYIGNSGSSNLSVYTIGQAGVLTPQGSPDPVAARPGIIDPMARFMYIGRSNGIEQYSIGSSGALSLVSFTPSSGNFRDAAGAVHPTGRFMYVTVIENAPPGTLPPQRLSLYAYGVAPGGVLTSGPQSGGFI